MTPAQIPDAVAALLATCARYAAVIEATPNRGVEIDYWVRQCGLDPAGRFPWCAAYVGQCGREAIGVAWPLPRTAGVQALVDFAKTQGLDPQAIPAVGDLLVVWHAALQRFGHVGVVAAVDAQGRFRSWEGNTNDTGGREGLRVLLQKPRAPGVRFRFLRWVELLAESAG